MKLYRNIIYQLGKKDTPQVLIERIGQAFMGATYEAQDIKFFLSDLVNGVSGIDRLVKHNPALERFLYTSETVLGHERRLSNLPTAWEGANPSGCTTSLKMQDTVEIISGIPRRYPLNQAIFIFDRLPMLSRNPDAVKAVPAPFIAKGMHAQTSLFVPGIPGESDYPSPCIRVQSDWWISGRSNFMDAIVELGDLSEGTPQLELMEGERQFLEEIGEIYHERIFAVPSNEEEAAAVFEKIMAGQRIVQSYYEDGNLKGACYPFKLEPLGIGDYIAEPLSVKKAIKRHFLKRGFSYNSKYSSGGTYTITRVTKHHYLVKLTFHRGEFDVNVLCEASIEGPLWKHEFSLPAAADHMKPYRVTRQIDVDHQIGNIAAAYDIAQKVIIEAIDDLYGAGPAWLTYL
ncbi:hypothetical protein DCC85_12545 [Paenibacillus sp. CAA11]|uniref:hypothetical protein n=1 Tax=Paenibacillus sp. CAA11 TaxID=1532905 RepID=UPI000D361B17|nr:hypothetical protein [Paenibacillus sp. CAA11]AWB44965.1 hypothetical protein DCC85_12545 [Paenibacillus sp. CAA11]